MQQQFLYNLLKVGLTEGEAKVYLALCELGSSSVGPIIKKAGIASSNVYDILNRLLKKGIVSYITKKRIKYFCAASPTTLLDYLQHKEEEIQEQKKSLQDVIPKIADLQKLAPNEKAEVFFGQKGLKAAYEKHLVKNNAKTENIFFYIHKKRYEKESDLFYFQILDLYRRVAQRGIVNEYARKSPWFKQLKKIKVRYISSPIPAQVEICDDSVLLVSWDEKITAVLIHSPDLADNFRTYFEKMWIESEK